MFTGQLKMFTGQFFMAQDVHWSVLMAVYVATCHLPSVSCWQLLCLGQLHISVWQYGSMDISLPKCAQNYFEIV